MTALTMKRFLSMAAVSWLLLATTHSALGSADDTVDEEEKRRSIRLKTTGQLKKIFSELDIDYDASMTKQQLQDLAYETDAVEQWLQLHPEKRRKKTPPISYGEKPDGMDQAQWERLMQQMHGQGNKPNFDHIQDKERRSILTKLAAAGLHMPGSEDMDIEKLRNLAKILDDIPNMGGAGSAGGAGGGGSAGSAGGTDKDEEDVQEL